MLSFRTLAGIPPITELSEKSFVTTALAPTTQFLPIFIGPSITAPEDSKQPSPISGTQDFLVVPPIVTQSPMTTFSPITAFL